MRVALGKRRIEAVIEPGEGVTVHAEGLITTNEEREFAVSVTLDPRPDTDWLGVWKQQDQPLDVTELTFEGDRLLLVVADRSLETAWEAIRTRVEATNAVYAEEVVPPREAVAARRAQEAAVRERVLAAAQQRLDALQPRRLHGEQPTRYTGEVRSISPVGEPVARQPRQSD